jgi:hypothetical protein
LEKKSGIKIIVFVLLTISAVVCLFSTYQIFIENNLIPYFLVLSGSIFGVIGFSAVLFSGLKGIRATTLILLTLLNNLLFIAYYYSPQLLKEFYPFIFWSLILIVLYSLQQVIQRHRKKFAEITKILNYGLIFTLLPFMLFKSDNATIWFALGAITGLILLFDLVVFLLPAKQSQSN